MFTQDNAQHTLHDRIFSLFARQTSPNVLNQLLKTANDVDLQLGGEQRTISVVFIDMRGYTTIAEMLPPAQVMNIIKTYIGLIADTLLRYGATLTHYGGDQIMAIFNAPLDQPDHAERAVRATIIAIQEISRFNHSNAVQLLPVQAVFGAGINTGKAVVGNVGTDQRHFYTAIGDTVNIAARLCAQAEPRAIYLGHDTISEDLGGLYEIVEPLGSFQIKGRVQPLDAYRIMI